MSRAVDPYELNFLIKELLCDEKEARFYLEAYEFDDAARLLERVTWDRLKKKQKLGLNPDFYEVDHPSSVHPNYNPATNPTALSTIMLPPSAKSPSMKSCSPAKGDAKAITNWQEYSIKKLRKICDDEAKKNSVVNTKLKKVIKTNEFVCSICLMDYYDGMMDMSDDKIQMEDKKMINDPTLINVVRMGKCKNHFFHKECLENMCKKAKSIKCPNCGIIYGIMEGEKLKGSTFKRSLVNDHCAGYEHYKTIKIDYYIPSGKNSEGKFYTGTYRVGYLPDNSEGRKIADLLKVAFDRNLVFAVGVSTTTGATNVVVWNGIHHKTSLTGGAKLHGYPDPTYLSRVREELEAKGVYESDQSLI